jgi:uncharacterized protein YukE
MPGQGQKPIYYFNADVVQEQAKAIMDRAGQVQASRNAVIKQRNVLLNGGWIGETATGFFGLSGGYLQRLAKIEDRLGNLYMYLHQAREKAEANVAAILKLIPEGK